MRDRVTPGRTSPNIVEVDVCSVSTCLLLHPEMRVENDTPAEEKKHKCMIRHRTAVPIPVAPFNLTETRFRRLTVLPEDSPAEEPAEHPRRILNRYPEQNIKVSCPLKAL